MAFLSYNDSNIINVNDLFNKNGIGDDDTSDDQDTIDYIYNINQEQNIQLDNQIIKNLQQLNHLIQLIKNHISSNDQYEYELIRLEQLNERLNNVNELFEFYQEKKKQSISFNELKFFHLNLIQRLNNLNNLFNLNKSNILVQTDDDLSIVSLLLQNKCEQEIKALEENQRKLRINSIVFNDEDLNQDLMCAVYQFDTSNDIIQLKPTLQHIKPKPKRSSSADNYNSTLKRRLRNNKNSKIETDLEPIQLEIESSFKLNEKCISISSFKFKLKQKKLNELVAIKANCTHLKIIIYKLNKLKTKSSNNQFKNPVKYVTINLINKKNYQLYETFNIELKQINLSDRMTRASARKETASSMFKRMFTKSRPPNSIRNSSSDFEKYSTISTLKNDSMQSFINFDLSNSQTEALIYNLDILNMNCIESWLNLWKNNLNYIQKPLRINEQFEILTIYLNKIENILEDDCEFYYYIQIRLESKQQLVDTDEHSQTTTTFINLFRSNLFKLNDDINDLCRIPFEELDLITNEKVLKFDLFKLDKNDTIKLAASNSVCLKRQQLTQLSELNLGHSMKFSSLKVKFSFQSVYYPTRRVAIDLFEFSLDAQNTNCLLSLVEIYLNAKKFNEPILVRKFLEFLSQLNGKSELKRILIDKLYEALLKLIQSYYVEQEQDDLKFILSNLKQAQSKQAAQFLTTYIKNIDNPLIFDLTMKCLNKLIEIIINLSLNKSKYEIKYELNDLIAKIVMKQFDYSAINLKFVSLIVDLYSPYELADVIISKFLNQSDQSILLINQHLFNLDYFKQNYQFRNKLVTFIVKLHLDKTFKLSQNHLNLVKNLLKFKLKLSKQNLDQIIKLLFKQLINLLINVLKQNENQKLDSIAIDSFICLFEIVNIIQTLKAFNNDLISNQELNYLFEIIIYYLKSSKITTNERIQLKINLIILNFSKFIQKHLQFYQLKNLEENSLIQSYFEMLFTFINSSNQSLSLPIKLKVKMLQTIHSFWSTMSSKLKYSLCLNEFLITKLCKCFISNFYFKLIEFKAAATKPINLTNKLYLNPFISANKLTNNCVIYHFYEQCLKMLNDIYSANSQWFTLDHFNEFILFNLMSWILNKESNIESRFSLCSNISSGSSIYESNSSTSSNDLDFDCINFSSNNKLVRNFSYQILNTIDCSDSNSKKSMLEQMRLCIDYNLIKDDLNEISQIEHLLLNYNLIKLIDGLNSDNKLFICKAYLNENRRQIKMHLLDDLYSIYKLEKNYQQMSFVRKQQSDLIELNLNRKNESDLKEIFYLKSLKKFAINSLNESVLPVSVATPSASSSTSASSFSSSSSSSSISLVQSTDSSEISKQLSAYYEKIDENYTKFYRILNAESKFTKSNQLDLAKHSLQYNGNLYFRIGIFGSAFKSKSIQNKYYLYKHQTYEMLSNIQNVIVNKLISVNLNKTHISLLHHNQEPDLKLKQSDECHLQLCAVNRLEKQILVDLIDEMNEDKETIETKQILTSDKYSHIDYFYYYDRPFYMRCHSKNKIIEECIKENESADNLWIERNILITDEYVNNIANLTQFEEVKTVYKIFLNPIRNAINDINEKNKELKQFINQFKTNSIDSSSSLNQIHNLQPLTMRLLGCLDARVNGGLIKYVRELINTNLNESKTFNKKEYLFNQLYLSIKEQLEVLQIGLNAHYDILKEVNLNNKEDNDSINELKYQKNYEHMFQLNEHLIDCFKLIEKELNDRCSKIEIS